MVKHNKIISLKPNEYRFHVWINNQIIAVTTITKNKNYITFSLVETDKKYRGKGIGKQMLLDCLEFSKKKWPEKTIILEAYPYYVHSTMDLKTLVKFYESVGFEVTKWKKESALMRYNPKSLNN